SARKVSGPAVGMQHSATSGVRMTERIRVGIIGVGWGALVQAPAFQVVPEYELVAICSRTPDRVARAADRLGIAETSTDWREFVRRDDLDLVSICTPTVLHHEQTLAALAAGKHVLGEKPMALNQEQAEEMLQAADESRRAHAVCFEGRWSEARLPVWDGATAISAPLRRQGEHRRGLLAPQPGPAVGVDVPCRRRRWPPARHGLARHRLPVLPVRAAEGGARRHPHLRSHPDPPG